MNFHTFRAQTLQLNLVMGASDTPEEKAANEALLYETLEGVSSLSDEELEVLWPEWSKAIVAAHTGDEAEIARLNKMADDQIAEAQAAPEPVVRDNGLYWGSIATGVTMAAFGGPAGWFAGYAVAKAGTAKAMGRF
jgi:hypothetical protein